MVHCRLGSAGYYVFSPSRSKDALQDFTIYPIFFVGQRIRMRTSQRFRLYEITLLS